MGRLGRSILFGSIGYMLGGPLGAILGSVIASCAIDRPSEGTYRKRAAQYPGEGVPQSQMTFFVATFSLLAKLAKADGVICTNEIQTIDTFMKERLGLREEERRIGGRIFNAAKDSADSFASFAEQFYQMFSARSEMLVLMLELLVQVATSDGVYHKNEELLILEAVRIFRLSPHVYEQIKKRYVTVTDKYYAILGCSSSDSIEVVKKQYRKMAAEYHPDKIIAKGLPDEFISFANRKFQEIQEAYEAIVKEKKSRTL